VVAKADPLNATAMNNIGNVLRQQGEAHEALDYYHRALKLRPDYVEAMVNLSIALRDLNKIDEAIEHCHVALKLKPNFTAARLNLGVLLQDLMRHEEAIEQFNHVLKLHSISRDAKWNKALSLLALGHYQEGWALHEIGLGILHMRGPMLFHEHMWLGEDLKNKRLLIWAEQGYGDTLQFIRYAKVCKARGAHVIVLCPEALQNLLSNCGFIDEVLLKADKEIFDFHVPVMSLPYLLDRPKDTTPYLHVSEAVHAEWKSKFFATKKLKVGLVWAGHSREKQINAHMADKRRSLPLELLRPLFDLQGVEFYGLQKDAAAEQIDRCNLRHRIIDFMSDVRSFEDTAAIIEHLDLVISVDTSVVHLAAGMGKPVWVLSRFDACWRWLGNRHDNPWYPTVRIFGQEKFGHWGEVVVQVKAALAEIVSKQT
jgi:hypothetical protein